MSEGVCAGGYRGVVGLDHGHVWERYCAGEYITGLNAPKLRSSVRWRREFAMTYCSFQGW
jgi:hypothetical protein